MAEPRAGKIFTFYSYKGGTGRSMALANFGCWLGRRLSASSRHVLLIDWDLEAPGLHRYFPAAESRRDAPRRGLIDYFEALRNRLDGDGALYERIVSDATAQTMRAAFSLDEYLTRDVVPGIDLLQAGTLDIEYARAVSAFDWIEFHSKYGQIFRQLRELITSDYSYCLIDSRTGFNDTSGICTMLLAEKLVLVFTPNRQSLAGVLDLSARAVEYRQGADDYRPLSIFPVPSRIENAEHELKQKWRRQYQQEFEATLKSVYQLDRCDLGTYFDEVLIPHISFYSYGEELAILREQTSDAQSLSRAYDSLFTKLDSMEFAWDSGSGEPLDEALAGTGAGRKPEREIATASDLTGGDIYISYAHIDNQPLPGEPQGWIDAFHAALEVRLRQLLGSDVRIWRDAKLTGADRWVNEVVHQIHNSSVFVAVISPGFVRSEWCMRELDEFSRQMGHPLGTPQQRVLKVVKTPIFNDFEPDALRTLRAYDFYQTDDDGRIREFGHEVTGPTRDPRFMERVSDVAFDLARLFRPQQELQPAASRPSVYVAESASDLRTERARVVRELLQRGYRLLPEQELPREATALVPVVQELLARCRLSVHLLGNSYGIIPEGSERSIVELQTQLAAERARTDPSFARLLWMPAGLQPTHARQQAFLQELEATVGVSDQLLIGNIDALKWTVLETLKRAQPEPSPGTERLSTRSLYLIFEREDTATGRLAQRFLREQGLDVRTPAVEEPMRHHRKWLAESDAILVCWGLATDQWLRAQVSDVRKAPAWRRQRQRPFSGVLLADPPTPSKEGYEALDMTLNAMGQDLRFVLPAFVTRLQDALAADDWRRR